MSFQGNSVLAVVPARGGSKSIPRKNLETIAGLSLVGYAARVIAGLPWIDQAVLSTDDVEIADEGRLVGLSVPFMRPDELAGDLSGSADMWRQVWLAAEEFYNTHFDISVLLEPTSPLRRTEDVERAVKMLVDGGYASAVTVSRTPAHYTPHKTLLINENGLIEYYHYSGAKHSLRQSIPPYYHRNGLCYAVKRKTLIDNKIILDRDCAAIVVDRPVVNVDDPMDLKLAELLIKEESGSLG